MKIIENLVLSGGGIKGYIHIGVLKALQEKGYLNTIKRFCGTSIGAFVSLLLVLSLSPQQIEELFLQMNLQAFLQLIPEQILSLLDTFGINDGKCIDNIVKIILKNTVKNENITFIELFNLTNKDLIVTGTCMETYKTHYFSRKSTPTMEVKKAICISMCLPFLFNPISYNDTMYVDGAISSNFPMEIFQNQMDKTIGVILHGNKKNSKHKIPEHIFSYGMSLFRCMSSNLDEFKKNIWKNQSIPIYFDIDTVDLEINISIRKKMVQSGYDAVCTYLEQRKLNEENREIQDYVDVFVEKIIKDVLQLEY